MLMTAGCASSGAQPPVRVASGVPARAQSDAPDVEPATPAAAPALNEDDDVAPEPPPVESPEPPPAPEQHYAFNDPLPGEDIAKTPAMRYATLSPAACPRELRSRKLGARAVHGNFRGIANPERLAAPLHGVHFVAPGSRSQFGVLDCRLALALDDFAAILEQNDVIEIRVDNFYRARAHLPGKKRKKSQHAYGLAADVTAFGLRDGRTLEVGRDWHAAIGAPVCGPDARVEDPSDEAIRLRNIVCEAVRAGVFHHILTPSFNKAHATHLHLDIARDAWAIIAR
jgi:hypothetical protein